MRQILRVVHWPSMCLLIIFAAAACASLPPAKPVTNVSQIAGAWQGTASVPLTVATGAGASGTGFLTATINPDGSYSSVADGRLAAGAALLAQAFTGKITVAEGKLRSRTDQGGIMGTWTLHEGEGKGNRVLVYRSDDGRTTADLTPVR
jgi:hypothetical protein